MRPAALSSIPIARITPVALSEQACSSSNEWSARSVTAARTKANTSGIGRGRLYFGQALRVTVNVDSGQTNLSQPGVAWISAKFASSLTRDPYQSQRDCASKPKVARQRATLGNGCLRSHNPNGVATVCTLNAANKGWGAQPLRGW
jgi:hypothetical protein